MGLGETVRSEDCSCFLKSLEVFAAGLSHQGLGGARDVRSFTDGQCWGLSAFGSRRKYGSVLLLYHAGSSTIWINPSMESE